MKIETLDDGTKFVAFGPKMTALWVMTLLGSLGIGVNNIGWNTEAERICQAKVDEVRGDIARHRDIINSTFQGQIDTAVQSIDYVLSITEKRGGQIGKNSDMISALRVQCGAIDSLRKEVDWLKQFSFDQARFRANGNGAHE